MSACAGLDVHHDSDTNTVMVSFDLPGLQKEDVKISRRCAQQRTDRVRRRPVSSERSE